MITFQDLQELGNDEKARREFLLTAINSHKSSDCYRVAYDAKLYYDGENPTIHKVEKIIYDLKGMAHRNMWTANHKIASKFFGFVVDQQVSYLLGNGVTFSDSATKDKLGVDFEDKIFDLATYAEICGVSFGFWNYDHLEIFDFTEFVPLYDEETGALKAGIRFWCIDSTKPLRITLYELDGYTEYIKRVGEDIQVLSQKTAYKKNTTKIKFDGTEIIEGENYPTFPIIPFKNNEGEKSEICGKRNTIDALDLISSGMVNNCDNGELIYWAVQNAGGMDEVDAAKLIKRIITSQIAFIEDAPEGARIEPHTVEAPVSGNQATIDMLKKQLYEDFQAFDSSAVSAGNQTATAIKACYVPLDLKTDKFEKQVTRFIMTLLEFVGVEDKPTYTRNQIINKSEEIQSVLLGAQYFDDEYTTKKILTILGDADEFEEMQNRKMEMDINRFQQIDTSTQE